MNTQDNPYVGPRTFLKEEGHLFFGRDREARDLSALVAANKLVLFYAQSGAGKSSLINTRLIPGLEDKHYKVLPIARVSGNWLEGGNAQNIYIYNLLRSLIQGEIASEELPDLTLSEFLAKWNEDQDGYFNNSNLTADIREAEDLVPWRQALIIDQFEELFSTHPEAWKKREDFFSQLTQAMQDYPYLWVVLVMREDYIAALDPYAYLLPGGLKTRYYMQRLSREAAIKAVRKPVEKLRPYEEGIAEKLVEDLSRIKVQKPDGTQDLQPGQYIEPVQLQVVCYGLWQNLPPEGTNITEKDLLEVGDVDEALGKYYARRIAEVAQAQNVKERLIREWVQNKLIAPGGIRNMVLQETGRKSGLVNDDVIQALQSDLVRAENRGGALWYELTHDRLVGPILENNKSWFDENLSPLQRQAKLWNDQARNESWLLRDQALEEVETWAKANPEEVLDLETEFLEACRKQQEEIKLHEQARSARRLVRFVAVVAVLGFIALVAAGFAISASINARAQQAIAEREKTRAEEQAALAKAAEADANQQKEIAEQAKADADAAADRALAGSLAAQAASFKNSDYTLALLLGLEAYQRDPNLLTRTALFQLLQFTPYQRQFGFNGPVSSVAVSPDGNWFATASCVEDQARQCTKGGIQLFNAETFLHQDTAVNPQELSKVYPDFGIVYSLAFHQYADRLVLAAGGCVPAGCTTNQGQITLWDVSDPEKPVLLGDTKELRRPGLTHSALVKTIAFSPDGEFLASGSYDTTVVLWKITDLNNPSPQTRFAGREGHASFVNSVAFSLDGNTLVSASDDTTIRLWDRKQPNKSPQVYENPNHSAFNSIAFSPDGKKFAAAGDDNIVRLWDWREGQSLSSGPAQLEGHTGYVKSVAFKNDGTLLASTGFDNKIILWDTSTGQQIGSPLSVHAGTINSLSFGSINSDGKESPYLISGSNDRTLIQWDLSARQPLSATAKSEGELPPEPVLEASNSQFQASVIGQQIDVKDAQSKETFLTLDGFDSPVQYVKFGGQNLLTMDQGQLDTKRITIWNIESSTWVDIACKAINRNLTSATWTQFTSYLNAQSPKESCVTEPGS